MCGICGFVPTTNDAASSFDAETLVRSMTSHLAHRGPDGSGFEQAQGAVLGHRRLSIIDLSAAGAQPLWDAERRAGVSYNGEIYNFKELREECRRAGFVFRSSSDTEVLVNAYLLHGPPVFDRLDGIFAFCLLDARTRDVFLVRDPMGIKPLYYAETPKGLFFASELKALVASGAVSADVDPAALAAYLQLDFVPSPMSMVQGVKKLPGGHFLRLAPSGAITVTRYTTLDEVRPRLDERRFEDDLATFDALIHDTVSRQLVSDVPLGVFLSGGLDSSIVARTAAEILPGKISTFSIGFEDPTFDESRYFSAVARAIGSDHHTEVLRAETMLDLIPNVAQVASEPLADGSIFPTILLSRFARRSVTVALSGDGADELFAGYPTYPAARLAAPLSCLPRGVRRAAFKAFDHLLPVDPGNFSLEFKIRKLLSGLHPDPVLQNARWLGTFREEDLPNVLLDHDATSQKTLEALLHEPADRLAPEESLERLLVTDQRFYLQDGVLVKVDRASMSVGLEVRVPFLGNEMVRFARSLPHDRKLRGRKGKYLLRRYAEGRLPESVVSRGKKGFGAPLGRWFRGELRPFVTDVLAESRVASQGFFRPAFVARLLSEHFAGKRDHRKAIFNLLVFSLWHDAFASSARRREAA